jgi:hypothetical protein
MEFTCWIAADDDGETNMFLQDKPVKINGIFVSENKIGTVRPKYFPAEYYKKPRECRLIVPHN